MSKKSNKPDLFILLDSPTLIKCNNLKELEPSLPTDKEVLMFLSKNREIKHLAD